MITINIIRNPIIIKKHTLTTNSNYKELKYEKYT